MIQIVYLKKQTHLPNDGSIKCTQETLFFLFEKRAKRHSSFNSFLIILTRSILRPTRPQSSLSFHKEFK